MGLEELLLQDAETRGIEKGIEIGFEKGVDTGAEKETHLTIESLLLNSDFDDAKIALTVRADISLVKKIRTSLGL
jgi:hypothetical protein